MARSQRLLQALFVFAALSALGGGIALVTGTLPVPMYLLRNTPFDSFVIPGLFLGVVIGGSSLIAAIAVRRRAGHAPILGAAAGLILIGWITGETILVEGFSWLQGLYLLTGVLIVAASLRSAPLPADAMT